MELRRLLFCAQTAQLLPDTLTFLSDTGGPWSPERAPGLHGDENREDERSFQRLRGARHAGRSDINHAGNTHTEKMRMASEDLLVTLQILPGFFSNCLFLALYDSVVLVKRAVSLLSCSRSTGGGERRRMLTSVGLRSIWNSFMLDAYKQVKAASTSRHARKFTKV
ncbi:hypothetical protein LDENG_00263370 [Lucifuga dentata]|nr:hypothetical protein LDENG_00263370 [Lucifuga dentata]